APSSAGPAGFSPRASSSSRAASTASCSPERRLSVRSRQSADCCSWRDGRVSCSRRSCRASVHAWSVGDHLTHRFNPELGTGRITAIDGRVLVEFPKTGTTLRLAATSDALVPEAEQARERDRSLLERLARGDADDPED